MEKLVELDRMDRISVLLTDHHYLHSAGVATPDPGEAPPMAGFNIRSPWLQNARFFHSSPNGNGRGLGREKYVKGEEKFLRPAEVGYQRGDPLIYDHGHV